MLLRGRRKFFRKEMSYAELREYYKDSASPISKGKTPTKEQLKVIRAQLIKERKRFNFYRIVSTWIFTLCFLVLINYSYNNFTFIQEYFIQTDKEINYESIELENKRNFEEKMIRGISQFEQKKYFLAIGNFKNALRYNQTDSTANYYLARAYFRMCKFKKQACNEAQTHAELMCKIFPNSSRYLKLKAYYERKLN
ncbi:MAG: hypothetical protein HND54_04400 [Bacteroidetes bacterium]|nr:hypothetical protein [Bacteroidota bacterium]